MMRPRRTFGGMRRPDPGSDDSSDEGADADEDDDEPVDVVAREEDEDAWRRRG